MADEAPRRISFIDTKGKCIIGMEKRAMMPLIIFEVVVNAYLNILFIIPLRSTYHCGLDSS